MKSLLLLPLVLLLSACGNTYVTEIRGVVVRPIIAQPAFYQDSLTVTTTSTTVETDTLYP